MEMGHFVKNRLISLAIICLVILCCLTTVSADVGTNAKGFDKGPSYASVIPLKKATFVAFDDENYLDDYAYLAAVPTTVFGDDNKLYSNPLLFYQDGVGDSSQKNLVLNSRMGIDYFMDDWQSFCEGKFDEIVAINVDKSKVNYWNARDYKIINGDDPYKIANELALHEWSYSKDAVIAVIDNENQEQEKQIVSGTIKETFPTSNVKKVKTIDIDRINCLEPQFEGFDVPEGYGHIKADVWWDAIFTSKGTMISSADPSGNPIIQLYFNKNNEWIQTESSSNGLLGPLGHKYTQAYVYQTGSWRVGIVDLPTEAITTQGQPLKALFSKTLTYHVDISMYPSIDTIKIPENPTYDCKDVSFILEWNSPDTDLGFSIISPSGEAIYTELENSDSNSKEINLETLGMCLPGENYSILVFATNNVKTPVEFEIKYSWDQYDSEEFLDSITSAMEASVFASTLNAPLLYTSKIGLSKDTGDVLYKLGVENIYIVDVGDYILKDTLDEIRKIGKIKAEYKTTKDIYDAIHKETGQSDVIFTTIDPWSYWNFEDMQPAGEKKGALFIGPATYIAAHHGSPPILIEKHPRLSSAAIYHNEFWLRFSEDRDHHRPSTAEMVITGERIYEFLKEYGFDKEDAETIITVADQFDIGMSWDRIFPGVANSGRFCGSPVDTSYSISRNMFYPALVFQNPALNGLVELENGSISKRQSNVEIASLLGFLSTKEPLINININGFKTVRKEAVEEFEFPVLCSFVAYQHRFNERAGNYYDAKYTGADGLTPGYGNTQELIDRGSMAKLSGNTNSIYPDMTESEIIPFYLRKGGYSCAFSTSLDSVVENLNKGVILWIHSSHGSTKEGGTSLFWKPEEGFEGRDFYSAKVALTHKKILDLKNTAIGSLLTSLSYNLKEIFRSLEPTASVFKEKNPWRGYEWYSGSTQEPDTMSADIKGTIPYTGITVPFISPSSMDWTVSYKPFRTVLNKIIPFVDPFDVENLNDGVIGSIAHSKFQYYRYSATDIEENLENLHSAGFVTTMCDTANTYLHLMLIRHGTVFQIQNPWSTSQYGSVWQQSIPRDIALGNTVGEAYTKGLSHVGNLYLGGINGDTSSRQLWWDNSQSIVYFGDPDLRVFVPSAEYGTDNYWQEKDVKTLRYNKDCDIAGHAPFGATKYPNAKQPESFFEKYAAMLLMIALILIIIVFVIYFYKRRGKQ